VRKIAGALGWFFARFFLLTPAAPLFKKRARSEGRRIDIKMDFQPPSKAAWAKVGLGFGSTNLTGFLDRVDSETQDPAARQF
jgi:hypothetical protein